MTCSSAPGQVASPPLPDGRNRSLDGLRGAAAVIVVVFHYMAVFLPASLNGDPSVVHLGFERWIWNGPLWFLINGQFAVAVFFVLSGYVLTADFMATGEPTIIMRRAAGRLLRLGLPAGASTIGAFLLLRGGFYRFQEVSAVTGADTVFNSRAVFAFPYDLPSLLDNLFWRTWFAAPDLSRMYNLVLWTMPIELWGSLIVLSAALLLGQARWRSVILLLATAVLWGSVPVNGPYIAAFVSGTFLAAVRMPRLSTAAWGAIAAAGLACGAYNGAPFFESVRWVAGSLLSTDTARASVCGIGAFLLVTAVLQGGPLGHLFARREMVYLGRISFSLYLVHQPIIYSLGCGAFLQTLNALGYPAAAAISFVLVLAASFAAAHLAERWIDRPAILIARRLAAAIVTPAPPQGRIAPPFSCGSYDATPHRHKV